MPPYTPCQNDIDRNVWSLVWKDNRSGTELVYQSARPNAMHGDLHKNKLYNESKNVLESTPPMYGDLFVKMH